MTLLYNDDRTMVSDGEFDNIDLMNKYKELGLVWFPEFRPLRCKYENTSDYWVGGSLEVETRPRKPDGGNAQSQSGVPVSDTTGGHGFGPKREVWVRVTKKLKLGECPLTADWQWFPFDIQTVGL